MNTSLDIIIVNRNSGDCLRNCLASIESADKRGFTLFRVCIVDDLSDDHSLRGVENANLPICIIRNATRRGYGASCNLGAKGSRADYLLFLNTDVVLSLDSLCTPLIYMERPENSQVAITGIKLLEKTGEVNRSCARFPTVSRFLGIMFGLDRLFPSRFSHLMKDWDHLDTREVDQVMGAFMMMRRKVFEDLGGYDERFFVYMEDLDLSLRVKRLRMKSIYLPTSSAYHVGGATAQQAWAESLFLNRRSRIQYGFKHFKLGGAILVLLGTTCIEPFTRLIWAVVCRSRREVMMTIQAYLMLWRSLPELAGSKRVRL